MTQEAENIAASQAAAAAKAALVAEARKITREEERSVHFTNKVIRLAVGKLAEDSVRVTS